MARKAFMMSTKKQQELKQLAEQEARAAAKRRDALMKSTVSGKAPLRAKLPSKLVVPSHRQVEIPSRDTGGFAAKRDEPRYTGTNIIGLAVMHKSNTVPVFNAEDAVALARMRRG